MWSTHTNYMILILQATQNRTDLQPNVIYSHKLHNGFLQNKPIMRILLSQSQPPQITLKKNSHTERINKQQTPHSDDRPATYNPTNLKSRQTTSQIVLFSTKPTSNTKPFQDSYTMQITNAQLYTFLPYQTIKTLLTNIMEAFMHLINHSHFLYNAVHIAISSRLQRTTETLTELCKET